MVIGILWRFLGSRSLLHRPRGPFGLQQRLLCTCCAKAECLSAEIAALASDSRQPASEQLDDRYSPQQQATILHMLNTATQEELAKVKLLRGRKSANLVTHRTKRGPFTDIQSLTEVPLFKEKTILKVCQSILNPDPESERKEKRLQGLKFIKPDIEKKQLQNAKSIVSIVFGIRKIAWTHMDRSLTVLDWQQEESHRYMTGTYLPSVYLEEVSLAVSKIPPADYFVLERPSISIQNTNLFPVTLHLRTIESMLHGLLGGQFVQDRHHRVLSVVRSAVGKHFGLMVGESRTSGRDLVQRLMSDSVTKDHPRVAFPRDMLARYRKLIHTVGPHRAEEMCDALLQAVAFYEFVFSEL
ncbi:transcription elongation factor, mitochondrial [Callorhinchus milii]|uniref:Transcription elongation factor, mitochondrial n=1 Tax=Callorhinchus milii TaxID=7868 RepID=A0A4W3JDZ4_CALMI|nr:transcription elongation factor, mitochondrial [Callorhinchus milii]|eukprot:gi/632942786/ref/XP_007886615.1/ PREDICTED: transcription elongation factor, mitochondrial [Callorhinchus milii]